MAIKAFERQGRFPIMGKLAISFLLVALHALAASDDAAIQNTFVKPWVEALRSKDQAKLERFMHPAVRACINPKTKEFFDYILDREIDSDTSGPYKTIKISPMQGAAPLFYSEDQVAYPVRPTYRVDVEFEQRNLVFTRFLAPSNGSWFEVFPCPKETAMAAMHQQFVERIEKQKKAAALAAALKDPLRGELQDLLRQEQKIDAVKKYQKATGVDLTTAMLVMDALQKATQ